MRRSLPSLCVCAGMVLLLASSPAGAQTTSDDPDCEEDPFQAGCDPACTDPTRDCAHPPCPTHLAGTSPDTGGVFMSWTLNSRSDVRVYRATGDAEFQAIAYLEFPTTRFLDEDAQPGVTYRYTVTAVGLDQRVNEPDQPAEGESPACEVLEIAAVPFFGSWWATTAALVLATLGVVWVRRRS